MEKSFLYGTPITPPIPFDEEEPGQGGRDSASKRGRGDRTRGGGRDG